MPGVSDGARRVCEHCGAPLRELVDGFCPFCRTRPLVGTDTVSGPPASSFTVVLLDAGDAKIQVIKELRDLVQRDFGTDLGLKEAKDLVDAADRGAPPALIVDVGAPQARSWAEAFARVGAQVEVRPPLVGREPGGEPGGEPAAGAAGSASATYDVHLLVTGPKKINVIKEIRELGGFGLREAKDLADGADRQPQLIVTGLAEPDARVAATRLSAVGATAEIRPS